MSNEVKYILLFGAAIFSFFVNDAIFGTIVAFVAGANAIVQLDGLDENADAYGIFVFAAILNGISLIYNISFFF